MSSRRILVLVVAVALAGVAAFSTYNYVSTADERATQDAELVPIFRVQQLIPRGLTFGEARAGGYIGEGRIPAVDYPVGSALLEDQFAALDDKVALIDIPAGQLLVGGLFVDREATQVSFSDRLEEREGMVAVSLSVDQVSGVAGFIVPGDRVNMLVSTADTEVEGEDETSAEAPVDTLSDGETPTANGARYLLQYVEVLAVGQEVQLAVGETDDTADGAAVDTGNSGLITVALTSEDAARMVLAKTTSSWAIYMTLLPPDYVPTTITPITEDNLFDAVLPVPGSSTTTTIVAAVSDDDAED
jgi:Flp pilus assembly protein CpaB